MLRFKWEAISGMVAGRRVQSWLVVCLLALGGLISTVRKQATLRRRQWAPLTLCWIGGIRSAEAAGLSPSKLPSVSAAAGTSTEQSRPATSSPSTSPRVSSGDRGSSLVTSNQAAEARTWKLWADLKLILAQRHQLNLRQHSLYQRWKSLEAYTVVRWRNRPSTRLSSRVSHSEGAQSVSHCGGCAAQC